MLRVERLSFRYAGAPRKALDSLDLQVGAGQHLLILGPTGAGKTTLCCALRGLLQTLIEGEVEGEIEVCGQRLTGTLAGKDAKASVARLSGTVGLVFQDFERQLFSTNVEREIAFGLENLNVPAGEIRRRIDWALDIVGLKGFEDRNPQRLSGGEKQRLAIASVLAMRPRILILDEPTTDLDPVGKESIFALRERLAGEVDLLLMVEHEIEPALEFERLLILAGGRKAVEGGQELLADRRLFESNAVQSYEPAVIAAELGLGSCEESALRERLSALPRHPSSPAIHAPARDALRLSSVTAGYDAHDVLRNFSLQIGEGEFVAILGPNGCGKTTVAKVMARLLRPASGRVEIFGDDTDGKDFAWIASRIGYVFQNPDHQIFASTISEEVAFGPRNMGLSPEEVKGRVQEVIETFGLDPEADPFTRPKGVRQMVAVASVLAMQPRMLILDEPTTGLDLSAQRAVMNLLADLNRAGRTIVIITHSMRVVLEHATRTLVMRDGRILLDGPTEEVFYEGDLASASLRPPPIVSLGRMAGIRARSLDDLLAHIRASRAS